MGRKLSSHFSDFLFCGLAFSTPLCLDRVHRTAVCGIQYPEEPFLRRLGEHRGHPPNDLKHLRYGGGAHTAADAALIINRYCHIAASFSHEYYNGNLPFLQQLSAVKGCGLTGRSHRFCNTFSFTSSCIYAMLWVLCRPPCPGVPGPVPIGGSYEAPHP